VLEGRRSSTLYVPVPRATTRNSREDQILAEGAYGTEFQRENEFVNKLRGRIDEWRSQGYPGLTKVSRDLLMYWSDPERPNKLFFCQIEALETIMWVTEVAERAGEAWVKRTQAGERRSEPGSLSLSV
jgi:type III restriction enzyme